MGTRDPGEPLTRLERIEAVHWLRGFDHHVQDAMSALHPAHGMATVNYGQWNAQIDSLTAMLERIRKLPVRSVTEDRG